MALRESGMWTADPQRPKGWMVLVAGVSIGIGLGCAVFLWNLGVYGLMYLLGATKPGDGGAMLYALFGAAPAYLLGAPWNAGGPSGFVAMQWHLLRGLLINGALAGGLFGTVAAIWTWGVSRFRRWDR